VSWGAANHQRSPPEEQAVQASDTKEQLAPKTAKNPGKKSLFWRFL